MSCPADTSRVLPTRHRTVSSCGDSAELRADRPATHDNPATPLRRCTRSGRSFSREHFADTAGITASNLHATTTNNHDTLSQPTNAPPSAPPPPPLPPPHPPQPSSSSTRKKRPRVVDAIQSITNNAPDSTISELPHTALTTTTTTTTTTKTIATGASATTTPRERVRDDRRPAPTNHSLPWSDDPDGHLIFKLGDGLYPTPEHPQGRYKILSSLGEGTFGKVVECWDRRLRRRVAVKIVRSISKYREAALLEIDVLVHISIRDPKGIYHCVKLYSWFEHLSHVCMVFEKLGPSLYEHLRKKRFRPFSIDEVRTYAFQLLESVSFVHSLTLIHTDLKPENILLVDSNNPQSIKLIDFGSATFENQHHSAVVSTRHYRAPEVILGLGWTYPCDLWSVGCILVELYTGQALFQTHENLEHLAMMSVVLGPIPQRMILRANDNCREYFRTKRGGDGAAVLNWPGGASSKASLRSVKRVRSLADMVRPDDGGAHFLDLLKRLLAFEPETRCTSEEALSHPFFMQAHAPNYAGESDYLPTSMTHSSGSSAPLPARTANIVPKMQPAADPDKSISRPRKRMRSRGGGGGVGVGGSGASSGAAIDPCNEHGEQQREENSGTVSRSKSRSKTAGATGAGSVRRRAARRQTERQHYLES